MHEIMAIRAQSEDLMPGSLLALSAIILALIGLAYAVVTGLIMSVPVAGWIVNLFLGVAYGIFHARYLVEAYESVPAPG